MISCVEFAKNTSRDKLGHCIPEGEYGVIINKREYDFYGQGPETNYYIKYQLSNGEECTDLVTEHDYLSVNLRDTLTHDSARPFCEKNFGEPCNEALKSFLIGFIFFILIVGVPASLLWLIRKFLGSYIANSVIGRTWVLIRKIFTNIVEAKYGCFIYLLILLLAILLTGIVVWNTMIEVSMNNVSIIDFLKTMGLLVGGGSIIMLIIGGFSKIQKNLMILALGAVAACSLIFFFRFVIGLDFEYMVKSIFGEMNGG